MMTRFVWAAAAVALFGVGTPAAQAQCACARPSASGVKSAAVAVTAPAVHVHPATAVAAPAASCPLCAETPAAAAPAEKPKAEEKPKAKADKEVTLTGTMVCAKCGLKEADVKKCTNAIQVKDGEKTVTYFLDDQGNGEGYHEGLCGGGTKEGAKVTGVVSEKDGKKWVKVSKVEEKK